MYGGGGGMSPMTRPMEYVQQQQYIQQPMQMQQQFVQQPMQQQFVQMGGGGRLCGIGMLLGKFEGPSFQDNYIYVLKLVPGGPAQLCGNIMVDDVLYKVDGTNVSGMELDQVFVLIRGQEDTPITLEFGRAGGRYKITLYRKGADYEEHRRNNSRNSGGRLSPMQGPQGGGGSMQWMSGGGGGYTQAYDNRDSGVIRAPMSGGGGYASGGMSSYDGAQYIQGGGSQQYGNVQMGGGQQYGNVQGGGQQYGNMQYSSQRSISPNQQPQQGGNQGMIGGFLFPGNQV